MSLKEVLQQCPKAANLYYQWAGKALKELQKQFAEQIPSDMESHLPDIDESIMRSYGDITLDSNFRNLYDFLDFYGVYVEVLRTTDGKWYHELGATMDHEYNSRVEAEISGFGEGILILEKKLNNEKDS